MNSELAVEPLLGEVIMFAGTFAPRGWAFCNGQLLPISQNQALFSILGTTYGGDGRTTFALPDLRGRVPLHPGSGPGLSTYRLGQKGGLETITLTTEQVPSHGHGVNIAEIDTKESGGEPNAIGVLNSSERSSTTLVSEINPQPIDIRQPYQAINYIIAIQGVFPSRN
ncbi:MAG: phage tail protein [Cytophagia bacterium]|nr:phage tail protein [Cytophagia bacterium]